MQVHPLENAPARNVNILVTVDQNILHSGIVQHFLQGTKAIEFTREGLRDMTDLRLVHRNAVQAYKAVDFQRDELIDGRSGPTAELRTQLFDAREQMLVRQVLDLLKLCRRLELRQCGFVCEFNFACHG